jgi:outer membrane protein assembly factor BamB
LTEFFNSRMMNVLLNVARKQTTFRSKSFSAFLPSLIITGVAVFILGYLVTSKNFTLFRSSDDVSTDAGAASPYESRYRYDSRRNGFSLDADFTSTPTFRWKFKCPTKGFTATSTPVVSKELAYFTCQGGQVNASPDQGQGLYALDINKGTVKWRVSGNAPATFCQGETDLAPSRMDLVGNTIYTYLCRNTVAINATTGEVLWTKKFEPQNYTVAFSAPVFADDRVYISTYKVATTPESYVAALSTVATNKTVPVIWSRKYPGVAFQDIAAGIDFSRLILAGGAGTSGGRVQLLTKANEPNPSEASNRVRNFPATVGGYRMFGPSSLKTGAIYVGETSGKVRAINRDNLAQDVWVYRVPGSSDTTITPLSQHMTVGKNLVVFSDNKGNVYAINNDPLLSGYGTQKWKGSYGAFKSATTAPSASMTNGVVYVGNGDGQVVGLKVADGTQKWAPIPGTKGTPDACFISGTNPSDSVWEVTIGEGKIFVPNDCGLLRVYGTGGNTATGPASP